MTLASDSITVTDQASGVEHATRVIGAKHHPVVMIADETGHLAQTLPTYNLWIPPQAVGANKLLADIFNPAASGGTWEVRGIWAIPKSDAAATATLAVELGLYFTSAAGTGGTAAGYHTGSALTAPVFSKMARANASLTSAQVTARAAPTGGATIVEPLWAQYIWTEETNAPATALSAFTNLLPTGLMAQRLTLEAGEGLLLKQGAVAGAGSIGFLIHLTRT